MRSQRSIKRHGLLAALRIMLLMTASAASVRADEYSQEAIARTQDEWNALTQTMDEAKTKFDSFKKTYQEWEDAVFSQQGEKGIELARQLFNLDRSQTQAAQDKLNLLRDMFNRLDKDGIKTKLESMSSTLGTASAAAKKAKSVFDFAQMYNPDHAKDNPTYGLTVIGKSIRMVTGMIPEDVPGAGLLKKLLEGYADVSDKFATVLDKLGKKIEQFRQGSLCAQSGYKQDQQAAFKAIAGGGDDCLTYFQTKEFPRLQGEAYEGEDKFFLYDPDTKRGYFANNNYIKKIYDWHELLIPRRALKPDWLSSRTNSFRPETEDRAREYAALFEGWKNKTDPAWIILEKIDNTLKKCEPYFRLSEEAFVANYLLDETHHEAIEAIIKIYKEHILLSGTVYEEIDGDTKPSSGAAVEMTVGGNTARQTTKQDGQYEIVMKGAAGDATQEKVTKDGFEPIQQSGRVPQQAVTGLNYTLRKGTRQVQVSGTVYIKEKKDQPAVVVQGATVAAAAASAQQLGSGVSDASGAYTLTIQATDGVTVTCTATKGDATGSVTFVVTGEAQAGVDITMTKPEGEDTDKGPGWIINVTVLDANGKPLPNATVTCTNDVPAVVTGADGTAVVGPIAIPKTYPEEPFAVTLTPSVVVQGGQTQAGSAVAVAYEGTSPSAVTLTIPVVVPEEVTISGMVQDANGVPVTGATVTGGTLSATSAGGGAFSIGPFVLAKDESVTLTATVKAGTLTFSGAPVTVTYSGVGKAIAGVVLVLDIETETDVTISGSVRDINGRGIGGAAVTCGTVSATTDASGQYTLPPLRHKLGTPVTISASIVAEDGSTVAGQVAFSPITEAAAAPVITIQVESKDVYEITVSGTVVDENSNPVGGATVTSGVVSGASAGDGSFSLPPTRMTKGQTVSVSATHTDGQDTYAGGPVVRTFDGTTADIGGVVIVLKKGQKAQVTVTGTVQSSTGGGLGGATVSGGGASTVTDGAGAFTLGPIAHELNTPLPVQATFIDGQGNTHGGSGSVVPTSGAASLAITIDVSGEGEGEGEDEDLDAVLDSLLDDMDEGADWSGALAAFEATVAELDAIAADHSSAADFFMQRLRELREASCQSSTVASALAQAKQAITRYTAMMSAATGEYGQLVALWAANPSLPMDRVDAEYSRIESQEAAMEARQTAMLAEFAAFKCDEQEAETETGDQADHEGDLDDVSSGAEGGEGVEICGDGIDNDGDEGIDECDAGCCNKNCQITVSDCGTAADDIFTVAVDGADVGVTPKGASNVFNIELAPGAHTVRVVCIDDGGLPGEADDIGTVCIGIVAYDAAVPAYQNGVEIGGGEQAIPLNGSLTVTFEIKTGTEPPPPVQTYNGSSLQGVEQPR